MNESVDIDRGHWLYRFAIDSESLSIYRCRRESQDLVAPEIWRGLASIGVSDVLIAQTDLGWQPFVEVAEPGHRWALAPCGSRGMAEDAARYFLETLEECRRRGAGDHSSAVSTVPPEVLGSAEAEVVAKRRDAAGWELVYTRQREHR